MKHAVLSLLLLAGPLAAAPADEGLRLYNAGRYAEAEAALRPVVAAEPRNAAACYTLGMAISHRTDEAALPEAVSWLEKAAQLAPDNEDYLADFGGQCLLLADRHSSFLLATRGRDAMEKAIGMDPSDLGARLGLMKFYAQAPWPLGSSAKALTQAAEIARRDPARGLKAYLSIARAFDRKKSSEPAREAYAATLKLDPGNAEARSALARLAPAR